MTDLTTMLGTADPEEQAARVQHLAQAPVITFLVQLDTRTDQVRVVPAGEPLEFAAVQHLLTRAMISEQLREAQQRQSTDTAAVE